MMKKITLLNMISGLLLQVCTIISGFIIPRIILLNFGSDVNGLVASLNQFLSYINLVEGGVTSVAMAALYRPIVTKDWNKVSSIVTTSKRFFNQIGLIFILYSICLALIYPIVFKVEFGYWYTFILTIILSLNISIQYLFSLTAKTLLNADKKVYIVSLSQIVIIISNIFLVYISIKIYPSIHFLKLISGVLFIIQPIIYGHYVKFHYPIDWKARPNDNLINSRWDGFAINIAAFIHNSTDITILTVFTDLQIVSVYSIYALVTNGLKQLISSIIAGINPVIGQAYASGDYNELNSKLDIYEYIIFFLVCSLYTMAALLIVPFIRLYTKGVNDVEYAQPVFGILLIISEALYLIKFPHLNLAYSAGKFKEITKPAYIEAIINIIVSIVLVKKFGLPGVTIGTIIAMTYRMIFHVYYTSELVPNRDQKKYYKKFFAFLSSSLIGFYICNELLPLYNITISFWIIYAFIYFCILFIVYMLMSMCFFKKEIVYFINYLKRK